MNKDNPDFDPNSTMINSLADQMRNTPPPQKTAEQMLIDRIKLLEMDLRESSELNEHLRERINHLKQELTLGVYVMTDSKHFTSTRIG